MSTVGLTEYWGMWGVLGDMGVLGSKYWENSPDWE